MIYCLQVCNYLRQRALKYFKYLSNILDNEIKFLTTVLRDVDEEEEQKTDGGELYK